MSKSELNTKNECSAKYIIDMLKIGASADPNPLEAKGKRFDESELLYGKKGIDMKCSGRSMAELRRLEALGRKTWARVQGYS